MAKMVLYGDLETIAPKINYKKYKNSADYYRNHPNPQQPLAYSWAVAYFKGNKNDTIKGHHQELIKKKIGKIDDELYYHSGISGSSLIKFLDSIKKDSELFFHNLKGFDGHIIHPLLINAGYNQIPDFDCSYKSYVKALREKDKSILSRLEPLIKLWKTSEYCKSTVEYAKKEKWNPFYLERNLIQKALKQISYIWNILQHKEYSYIVDSSTKIYNIKIGLEKSRPWNWSGGKNKNKIKFNKNYVLEIKDSLLLFPIGIKQLGESLSENFLACGSIENKDIIHFSKGLINYDRRVLYETYKDFENDGNEKAYLYQDVYILAKYINESTKLISNKNRRLTMASTSYAEQMKFLNEKLLENALYQKKISCFSLSKGQKRYRFNGSDKSYTKGKIKQLLLSQILPTSWLDIKTKYGITIWEKLYEWYRGGITFVNEKYRGQFVKNLTFIDRNSSYPADMFSDEMCPIGQGVKGNKKGYNYKLYNIRVKKKIINKKGLPFIHTKNVSDKAWSYRSTFEIGENIKMDSHEFKRFKKYYSNDKNAYDVEVLWSFKAVTMNFIFGEFIGKWSEMKSEAKSKGYSVLEFIAKLFQNGVYGKFGTKQIRISKRWDSKNKKWVEFVEILPSKFYLPIAICIASLARMALVDSVADNYGNTVYGDTDSLAIIDFDKENTHIELHKTKLGAWDIEYEHLYGVARRAKQYMFLEKGNTKTLKIAFAGINFDRYFKTDVENELNNIHIEKFKSLSLLEFVEGKKIDNQTKSSLQKGGVLIEKTIKNIKPIWEYPPTQYQKYYKKEHFHNTIMEIKKQKRIRIYPEKRKNEQNIINK